MADTELRLDGLEKLLKALKNSKPPKVKIGILGAKANRSGSELTNADIGAMHEFGTTSLPQRSFLRVPLADNLKKEMMGSGAFDKSTLIEVIKSGSFIPWLKKVAIMAEGIVADAFDSGGFGKWRPSNMKGKKNEQTLVETQQLRNSITSEIVE